MYYQSPSFAAKKSFFRVKNRKIRNLSLICRLPQLSFISYPNHYLKGGFGGWSSSQPTTTTTRKTTKPPSTKPRKLLTFIFCPSIHHYDDFSGPPEYTPWEKWSSCSKTCGDGDRARVRSCIAYCDNVKSSDLLSNETCNASDCKLTI